MHKYLFFEEYFPDTNVPGPMSNATVSTQSVEILVLAFQKLILLKTYEQRIIKIQYNIQYKV